MGLFYGAACTNLPPPALTCHRMMVRNIGRSLSRVYRFCWTSILYVCAKFLFSTLLFYIKFFKQMLLLITSRVNNSKLYYHIITIDILLTYHQVLVALCSPAYHICISLPPFAVYNVCLYHHCEMSKYLILKRNKKIYFYISKKKKKKLFLIFEKKKKKKKK